MKKSTIAFLFALVLLQGIALAETIKGSITEVNSQTNVVTIKKEKTDELLQVKVLDASSLPTLSVGTLVSLEADKNVSGSLEAKTITLVDESK